MTHHAMIDALFSDSSYVASKKLLDATALRHEALASNIANIETPGYQRVDLSKNFADEFATHFSDGTVGQMATPGLEVDTESQAQRADGNNVDMDKELLTMSSNTLQYNALTEFVSNSLKQLKVAITGQI